MLILSRREAESVCLGDDVVLTIVAVGNDKVRIGVKAPPGIRILRNELEIEVSMLPFQPRQSQPTTPLLLPAPKEPPQAKPTEVVALESGTPVDNSTATLTALVRQAVAVRRAVAGRRAA